MPAIRQLWRQPGQAGPHVARPWRLVANLPTVRERIMNNATVSGTLHAKRIAAARLHAPFATWTPTVGAFSGPSVNQDDDVLPPIKPSENSGPGSASSWPVGTRRAPNAVIGAGRHGIQSPFTPGFSGSGGTKSTAIPTNTTAANVSHDRHPLPTLRSWTVPPPVIHRMVPDRRLLR